jgi:hypothetical protein
MPTRKNWGSVVAGWFIERDEPAASETGQPADTAGSAVPDDSGTLSAPSGDYSVPSPTQSVFQKAPPPASGGQVDFDAVFESAGIDEEARGRVSKSVELLQGLPANTDVAVKKQIVGASLKAFGVPIEKIIEASVEEIQALDGYVRNGASDTDKLTQESDQRIKQYEEEIKNIRAVMQERVQEQQAVIKVCNDKKLEVQQILEFFGQEAVARVVQASPKLHDPSAAAESKGN